MGKSRVLYSGMGPLPLPGVPAPGGGRADAGELPAIRNDVIRTLNPAIAEKQGCEYGIVIAVQ
jgi:hypothetical protein